MLIRVSLVVLEEVMRQLDQIHLVLRLALLKQAQHKVVLWPRGPLAVGFRVDLVFRLSSRKLCAGANRIYG